MNCFIHEDRTAVATCVNCGKGMCPDCVAFFETTGGQNYGHCPVCRRNDIANEKLALERVRNDLWIQAHVEKKKARNKAFTALAFCIAFSIVILVLELAAGINLLKVVGLNLESIAVLGVSVSVNTLFSLVPTVVGAIIFTIIISKAVKKNYDTTQQGNAYELSRFELDKSLDSINTALVKNRSNVKRL
jgi:membrane protein implicated in regulation of membrane protease activity